MSAINFFRHILWDCLPFTVASWKKLNIEPIVVFVGKEEDFYSNFQSNLTINLLKEMNTYIIFLEPKKLSQTSFSQVS